jgi:hypothetical protein
MVSLLVAHLLSQMTVTHRKGYFRAGGSEDLTSLASGARELLYSSPNTDVIFRKSSQKGSADEGITRWNHVECLSTGKKLGSPMGGQGIQSA